MNDDLNNYSGLYLDSSMRGFLCAGSGLLDYYQQSGDTYSAIDKTSQLRELLDNLKNTEAEEYIDIVIEFLRKRLEKVLDNPDMVDSLDELRKLDSLDLANRVSYLETEVNDLKSSLSEVTTKLDKLLAILKNG